MNETGNHMLSKISQKTCFLHIWNLKCLSMCACVYVYCVSVCEDGQKGSHENGGRDWGIMEYII